MRFLLPMILLAASGSIASDVPVARAPWHQGGGTDPWLAPESEPSPQLDPEPPRSGFVTVDPKLGPLQGERASNADDPAIWIHPEDPSKSLLFLSDKDRGIYVFDLEGVQLQHVHFGTRLNNIDVRSGFRFGSGTIDIVAGNLRAAGKVAVMRIDPAHTDGAVLTVLADHNSTGNDISRESYGFTLYKRATDGAVFVFDKSKSSASIRQWRLSGAGGRIHTTEVRRITDVEMGVSEGFVADDELGFVYFAEEIRGIHKYNADPDRGPQKRLAFFAAADGIVGDREGLALYACADGTGYLVLSSQGNSTFKVYERQGANRLVKSFAASQATSTDGLDVSAFPVPGFPNGFVVIHDDRGARYFVYDWADVAGSDLTICPR